MGRGRETIDVLHVDDDPDFLELASECIDRHTDRADVTSVTSGREGLEELRAGEFDCVISDYDMPGQDGIDFLEAVREENPDLPFILFTGKGSEEIASEAISAGVTDYLQKGTGTSQYEVLTNRIENVVEQRRARAQARETEERLRTIAENTNEILWKFTAEWDELLFVNSPYEDVWGRSIDELQAEPRSFLEGVHPDDRDTVRDAMNQLSAGEPVDLEFRVNAEEDFSRWVWVQGEPVVGDEGEVEKVVGFARDVTERKEQNRRQETLINNIPGIVYRCRNEPDWPMELVEGDCESLTGYSSTALESGEVVWGEDILHPDDRERLWQAVQEALEADQPFEVTYRIIRKDGTSRWMWERGRVVDTTEGDQHFLEGFITDITDRREREQEVREERTINELALDNVVDFYWMLDTDGIVTDWSDESGEVTGYTTSEATGMHATAFFPDREHQYIEEKVEELRETGSATAKADFRRQNGEEVPYRFDGTVLSDPAGTEERLCGFGQDISDRVERERQLREERDYNEQLIETIPDIFYVAGQDGTLQRWNDRVGEVTGYPEGEIEEMQASEFFAESDQQQVGEAIVETLTTGEAVLEAKVRTAEGELIPYEFTGRRLTDRDGEVIGLVGIGRDITERLKRERRLQRERDRLEEFAGVVSHDLRNPLNVAESRLELVADECDSEHLEGIASAHERMERLIDDLLLLARAGKSIGETEPVDLSDILETCWRNVASESAELLVETDATVRADETRLQQLLENLLRNAVEHAGDDVTITVGDLPNGFYVEDDGEGIPADEREKVLSPGYSTSREGTGFGLSIVRDIADAHDWTLEVCSGDDGGARFEFTGVRLG